MIFRTLPLQSGDKINARAESEDLILYISKTKAVYKAIINGFKNSPVFSEPVLAIYCDEAAELPDGAIVERRNDKLKINV